MCFFGKSKTIDTASSQATQATEEKETAKQKARLLETEGQNKGAQLQANQGQSIRKVFGN